MLELGGALETIYSHFFTLQILKCRWVKWLAYDHITCWWQSQDKNAGLPFKHIVLAERISRLKVLLHWLICFLSILLSLCISKLKQTNVYGMHTLRNFIFFFLCIYSIPILFSGVIICTSFSFIFPVFLHANTECKNILFPPFHTQSII